MKLLRLFAAGLEAQFNRLESNRGMENGVDGGKKNSRGETELRFIHWIYVHKKRYKRNIPLLGLWYQAINTARTQKPFKRHV